MLSALTDILWTIYVILLIILVVVILYSIMYPGHSLINIFGDETDENEELFDGDEECYADELDGDHEQDQESIVYEKYRPFKHKIKIDKLNDDEIDEVSVSNATFKYSDFIDIHQDHDFLSNYRDALNISFTEKLKIYNRLYAEVMRDIKAAEAKYTNDLYQSHDTTLERLRNNKGIFETIISILNSRLKNNTIQTIKRNFVMMINNRKHGFKSLVGRENVKDYLALQIFTFCKNPRTFYKIYQNMYLDGKAGIGKTKTSETIGYIYSKSGILARHKFRIIGAEDLTSKYVNDSAKITNDIFMSCLEGILFIDEAYQLAVDGILGMKGGNHNSEAVTELVRLTGIYKGLSVVVFAGYKREMKDLMNANKGLSGRFPNHIHLKKYDDSQLTDILILFIKNIVIDIHISQEDANTIYTLINELYKIDKKIFNGQARDMENLSGNIARSINGTKGESWINNDTKNNSFLIFDGFRNYLRPKGISLNK